MKEFIRATIKGTSIVYRTENDDSISILAESKDGFMGKVGKIDHHGLQYDDSIPNLSKEELLRVFNECCKK